MCIINHHHLEADCLPKIVEIGNDLTLPALVASPRFCLLAGILFFFMIFITISILILKESRNKIRGGVKKSKWKFKMAFAMKGGGGLEGVLRATYLF